LEKSFTPLQNGDSSTPVATPMRAISPGTQHRTRNAHGIREKVDGWSSSTHKRVFDFLVSLIALVLLSPILLITAIAVKLSSRGPILFRQARMGEGQREFTIYKLRTMRVDNAGTGPTVTKAGDTRLTSIGATLRRLKLDELPQLYNVLRGDMSLVGARPKVPLHQTYVLEHRPGITGASALAFRNEEQILYEVPHHALDAYQVHVLMPLKMQLDERYMRHATFSSDLKVMLDTLLGRGEPVDTDSLLHFQHSLLSLTDAVGTAGITGVEAGVASFVRFSLRQTTSFP
jgi:lipopolysaccharide/colanic/teichoic acid biosynthesis glycosyltransferase